MRAIDGDVLFREMEKAQWYNNADRDEIAEELVLNAPTIEPRCETCEAFNKTRLLIPQPQRKKGMWIEHNPHKWGLGIVFECSECGEKIDCEPSNFCPNCGADMQAPEEQKKCDTCKHEKERWFSRCADCSDFELWENKE